MTALRVLIALTVFAAAPALAQTQTWQPRPGQLAPDPHRYQADQHRLEMERLRLQADQREALARQIELDARVSRQRLEAARRPEPVLPPAPRALRSIADERAFRLSAGERRRTVVEGADQIDAWLDRRPD